MKIRLYTCLLLFSFLFVKCDLKTSFNYKNFDYNWVNHPIHFYHNIIIDTTFAFHTLHLETLGEKKGIISSLLPLFQLKKANFNITVRLRYKTENCKDLSVIITSIGECENINSMDTIQLRPTEDWVEFTQIINTKKTYLLNTSIEAIGFDNNNANIWISDFEIFIDGKEIVNKSRGKKENIYITTNDVILWNNMNYHSFPFLEHKILALGESVHGTKTMNDIAIAILKERILKHQCRVILLEIPLEYSFCINRFVKNDSNFKLSDISTYLNGFLYSESIVSFIEWLKEYNFTHNENISVWGFDINHIQLKSRVDLFNFFYNLNIDKHIKEFDVICELLLDTKIPVEHILYMFDKHPDLVRLLNDDELQVMQCCIKIVQKSASSYYRFVNRDQAMSEITAFIVDNFLEKNEKATIFGHFGHLNYLSIQDLSIINYFSSGYYLKSKYKDDYRCIALTTNQGSAMLAKSPTTLEVSKLIHAPQESLEYQLERLKTDSVYLSMNKLHCSDVFKLRFIGNNSTVNQFRYIIPKSRMEGMLFIKEVVNIQKKEDFLSSNLNIDFITMNSYKEALEKIKNK